MDAYTRGDMAPSEEQSGSNLSPEHRRQAEQLFKALEELPASERDRAIDEADVDDSIRSEVRRRDSAIRETILDESTATEGHQSRTGPRRIGQYSIKRLIGTGGMGRVFEAVQDHPRRTIALKVMATALATEEALARFEYEVQILGRLTHPHIGQIYDAGTWDDNGVSVPYFAMEFIPGRTLDEYIRVKELGITEILELFLQVCDAISHGHERGIIHRDLKPGNILVDFNGSVKVIDFGVARATDSDMQVTSAQTSAGQLVGTLQYMSPEQCSSESNNVDIRADVYALGVVLFECLSRKLPYDFGGGSIPEVVRTIQETPPTRLSTINSRIPRDLEVVVGKALEKERARRYRSAGELGDDIRRFLEDEAIVARPPSLSEHIRRYARKHRATATAGVVVAVTLVVSVIAIIYFAIDANQQSVIAQREAAAARVAEVEATSEAERANRNFARLRGVFGELFGDLIIAVRNLEGGMAARKLMVEMGREQIEQLKNASSEAERKGLRVELARSHEAIGDLLGGERTSNLGDQEEALVEYGEAVSLWRAIDADGAKALVPVNLSRVLRKQSDLLRRTDPLEAKRLLGEARPMVLAALEANPDDTGLIRQHYLSIEALGNVLSENDPTQAELTEALLLYTEHRDLSLRIATSHPDEAKYARDVGLALRKVGWTRSRLGQFAEAEESLRTSLARFEANQSADPAHIRHGRDVAWGCWYLGEFLIDRGQAEEGGTLMVRCATEIVTVCIRDPDANDYRVDVRDLIPAVCTQLVSVGASDHAIEVRRLTLVRLQPATEQNPDNLALAEVVEEIRDVVIQRSLPSGGT